MAAPEVEDILEITPLQHGMLFHSLAEPDARMYFEQVCVYLPMPIDPDQFTRAWQAVVDRHQALRIGFHWAKLDKPVQVVHRQARLHVHLEDWSQVAAVEQMQRLQSYLHADRAQGMGLQHPPLMHVALFRLGTAAHQFIASFHHAILDGWSLNLVFAEFLEIYRSGLTHTPAQMLPPVPYSRYIAWLQQQGRGHGEQFWRQTLAGYCGTSYWYPHVGSAAPAARTFGSADHRLSATLTQALDALARRARATLNAVMQAGWAVVLSHYAHANDIVFGAIVSGRPPDLDDVERIVGLFINTIVVRAQFGPETSTLELVHNLHAQGLAAREFSHCALTDITRWSGLPTERELFDSLFIFENLPSTTKGALPVRATAIERTNYPLTIVAAPGREIEIKALFTTPLLGAAVVERLLAQYEQLLAAMAAAPEDPVLALAWLPASQRASLLAPAPAAQAPPALRLDAVFAHQAATTPERCAVIDGERRLTVAALQVMATRLARLLGARDAATTEVVALLLSPSADLVAAMLGVLMSGRAFLLLDPAYPPERLCYMLHDSGARVLLVDPTLAMAIEVPPQVRQMLWPLDADVQPYPAATAAVHGDALAYVIYTSGSTGWPKGVMQTHSATLNRFDWMWRAIPFDANSVCCHRTALGFVDVVWEILGPVLAGVPLVIVPERTRRDPLAMARLLAQHRVSRLVLVPALLSSLLELPESELAGLACVREWICSGEALSADLAVRWRKVFPQALLFNLYGSSEVAGDVTWGEAIGDSPTAVPIGVPIDGCEVLVLDDALQPVPWGVVGEVYVGGAHLALGYLGQPGLTALRFVPNPHAQVPGRRLYRMGDLARRLENGDLEYVGRADGQLKLRGMRIEPGEIEAVLRAHPSVRQVVVLALGERLVAALTLLSGTPFDEESLLTTLSAQLPAYMVPSRIHPLHQFPLLPNGKVDRHAVQTLLADTPSRRERSRQPPETPMEHQLAHIWQELLQVNTVWADDDFLALGGHSIAAMQLVSRVLKQTGLELQLALVFERRSLREMAGALDAMAVSPARSAAPGLVRVAREARQVRLPPGT